MCKETGEIRIQERGARIRGGSRQLYTQGKTTSFRGLAVSAFEEPEEKEKEAVERASFCELGDDLYF